MAHPNVAVVSPERETVLAVTRFNIYEDKLDTELFDPNSGQKSPLELFKPFNMKVKYNLHIKRRINHFSLFRVMFSRCP